MDDLTKKIQDSWDSADKLNLLLLDIANRYYRAGEMYASSVVNEASAFDIEMSSGYKTTVTEATIRAKLANGGNKHIAESTMRTLELMFNAITLRISLLGRITQHPAFHIPSDASQSTRRTICDISLGGKVEKTPIPPVSSPEAI